MTKSGYGLNGVPERSSDASISSGTSKFAKRNPRLMLRSVIGENEPNCENFGS